MTELSSNQIKAAILLVSGATVTATAEQLGLTRVTLHQWLKSDDLFIAHINSLKQDLIDSGRSALQTSVALAIQTINSILQDGESDVVRLNAAKEILNRTGLMTAQIIGSDDAERLRKERIFNSSMDFY